MAADLDLTISPALFPFAIDAQKDAVQFVRMSKGEYTAASFLDPRMFSMYVPMEWRAYARVREEAAGLERRCHFIFHISHVGSTLLSRLVGAHPALFSLREPAILRHFAEVQPALDLPGLQLGPQHGTWNRSEYHERLGTFLGLWSRTFEPGQTSVIKATSFVSEVSAAMMEICGGSRSVMMYVPPVTFLKALLGGAMVDIVDRGVKRAARLNRRLGVTRFDMAKMSGGEAVAMSWLCEMLTLHATAEQFGERVMWMDFDKFLKGPEQGVLGALRHFGADADDATAKGIALGSAMSRYAKAPEKQYTAKTREDLLAKSDAKFAGEIARGVAWLEGAAKEFPAARRVVEMAG